MKYNFEIESFTGFYESVWSSVMDRYEEDEKGHLKDEYDADDGLLSDLYPTYEWYRKAEKQIAEDYALMYFELIEQYLGIKFEYNNLVIQSPKEYNFATDRIFVDVEIEDWDELVKKLVALSEPYKERVAKYIHDNHTSYDGFISFMDNDYAEWLEDLKDPNNEFYLDCFIAYLLDIYMREDYNITEKRRNFIDEYISDCYDFWGNLPAIEWDPCGKEAKAEWEAFEVHMKDVDNLRSLRRNCPPIPGL